MNEPKRLDEVELTELKALQIRTAELLTAFGSNRVDELSVQNVKKQIEGQWDKHIKSQQEIMDKLVVKYGPGQLNIVDGTLTPLPSLPPANPIIGGD